MNSQELLKARAYEETKGAQIRGEDRPAFHLTPRAGWMNDPNGFSYYKGMYHMFYQYYPYKPFWGPMHWGHAVSTDLLHWTYLPAALAPDRLFDSKGCFSGSALTLPDGRHLLMYTGVSEEQQEDGRVKDIQTQCLAVGDGENYDKYEQNPVLTVKDLPEGCSRFDFRDPKIWREEDGSYSCVAVGCDESHDGRAMLFTSGDGFDWHFRSELAVNGKRFGRMWECPDFFALDGKQLLIVSPQDMLAQGLEIASGNGVICLMGSYDRERAAFTEESVQVVDYGIDFYAPQTLETPDGRRVMVGWMQNWDTSSLHSEQDPWFGQLTLPRELSIRDGRLIQKPVRELEQLRRNPVSYQDVTVSGACRLDGVRGRRVELELSVSPREENFSLFEIRFAEDERFHTAVRYRPSVSELEVDRRYSGTRRALIHQRTFSVLGDPGKISLRVILDRFSAEIFVNDGEQTVTTTIYTDQTADGISFYADGAVRMDLNKYDIE